MARFAESLHPVLDYAGRHGVRLGFEPEPGMLVDTMASYAELLSFDRFAIHETHSRCGTRPLPG